LISSNLDVGYVNHQISIAVYSAFFRACDMQKYPESAQRELFIYSGMTMHQPLLEISALIENEENFRINERYLDQEVYSRLRSNRRLNYNEVS